MKVIIDAQLPRRLSHFLVTKGIDAIHTLDLPNKNRTSVDELVRISESQNRIVVTKDSDFLDNHVLHQTPQKLILISTGNITNSELIGLFEKYIDTIRSLIIENKVIEITTDEIVIHQ